MTRSYVLVGCFLAVGCSRPAPPTITPEDAVVTGMSLRGIELQAHLTAYNPNRTDLTTKAVNARVIIDHTYDLGQFTFSTPVSLPAGQRTSLSVPLTVKLPDLPALIALGTRNQPVPYEVDGTVLMGVGALNLDIPFRIEGSIAHDQIARAVSNSLPHFAPAP